MIGAFFFLTTVAGTLATALCGYLSNVFQANADPRMYGYILASITCFCNVASIPFFYMAGRAYKKKQLQKNWK